MDWVTVEGHRLEVERIAGARADAPTLVFLHEGLGSIALWKDFPAKLAAATGCPALVYSRYGYGRSDPIAEKRAVGYMHDEGLKALPALLDQLGVERPILIGHSDGASIALIHAGGTARPVRALILEAPHVFVEDLTVASIAEAKTVYQSSNLKDRMARYHADPDNVFWGWNDIWLNPDFKAWNIEEFLPSVAVPVQVIQGEDDEYGTIAQVEAIRDQVAGPVEIRMLAKCKHSPHRDQEAATLDAMADFVARV